MVVAASAPHVEGHLEPDDQDAQVELGGPLSEGVDPMVLVQPSLGLDSFNVCRIENYTMEVVSNAVSLDSTIYLRREFK